MVDIQTLFSYLTPISLTIGVIYHIMTLNNTRKNQQLQLETRQAQLFMVMYSDFKRPDVQKAYNDVVHVWEWEDYEDFQKKYGRLSNWDEFNKYMLVYSVYEGLGVLIYRNLIDVKMIEELMRSYVIHFWEKIGPIMREARVRHDNPWIAEWTEYLYTEIKKIESTPAYLLKRS